MTRSYNDAEIRILTDLKPHLNQLFRDVCEERIRSITQAEHYQGELPKETNAHCLALVTQSTWII